MLQQEPQVRSPPRSTFAPSLSPWSALSFSPWSALPRDVPQLTPGFENRIVSDNKKNKPHDAESLAAALSAIKQRLNHDAHPRLAAREFTLQGRVLNLPEGGLSRSQVEILKCLFEHYHYPVRVVPRESGGVADDTGAGAR